MIRFAYIIAITRILGPEQYGLWAYVTSAYVLAIGTVAFGLETLAPIRLGADKSDARSFAAGALYMRLALLGVASVGIVIFAFLSEAPGPVRAALLLSIPALLGRSVANLVRAIFVGHENVGGYFRIAASVRIFEFLTGLTILVAGGDVLIILAVHAASWLLEGAIGAFMMRRLYPSSMPGVASAAIIRSLMRQGALLGASGLFVAWLSAGPIVLMRFYAGELSALAQVALCLQIASLLNVTGYGLLNAALPVLSRTKAAGDSRIERYAPGVVMVAIGAGVPAVAAAHFLGPSMFQFALGADYIDAGRLSAPAVIIAILMLAPAGYSQLLVINRRIGYALVANIAGALGFTVAAPFAFAHSEASGVLFAAALGWLVRGVALAVFATFSRIRPKPAEASVS